MMLLVLQGHPCFFAVENFEDDTNLYSGYFSDFNRIVYSRKIEQLNIIAAICTKQMFSHLNIHRNSFTYMLKLALKSMFSFKSKIPINIAYWGVFFTVAKKYTEITTFIMPILYFRLWTKTSIEDELLHLLIAQTFKKDIRYSSLCAKFHKKMIKKYGDNFIEIMINLYYTKDHPNSIYSIGLTLEEL
jgi:hypothetical protein